ncbi:DUF1576 domain-containing protein [Otoolea muris]|uniref:DUF1576 domain-containing protein n=1 Tax=Otoolea muris TaxID=2941515 RepID=UPI002FE6D814
MKGKGNMNEQITATRQERFLLLSLLPLFFILAGLSLQPLKGIFTGLYTLIREPDFLITDYIAVGGIGAALVNAGMMTVISIVLIYNLGMEMDGHTITSSCLMFGFSLFGKNLLNIWAIFLGVYLYSKFHRTHLSKYIYVALYGTSLSPIITEIMLIGHLPLVGRMLLSLSVGVCIGFVLPPLSTHVHYAHQGYSLYNVGFSAGIIATVIVSSLKSFGIETEARLIWSTGNNGLFLGLLVMLFGGMMMGGLVFGEKYVLAAYVRILKSRGIGGTDYLLEEGGPAVLLNMGINGLFATVFVLAVGGDLNGPTLGGIFTIVGFSATGKHLRNIWPIMAGVCLASLAGAWSITDPSAMLALLFSTTLAPIAGEFGIVAGLLAGFLHSSVALNVGIVYGGMNLYNNGFAGGIVAIFMVPVIRSIQDRRARAKGELSL